MLKLVLYIAGAWVLHASLASVYSNWFSSTKTLAFRLAHTLEIALLMAVTIWLYKKLGGSVVGWQRAGTILVTLAVIDGLAFALLPTLREQFDAWHFAAAYLVAFILAFVL